MGEVAPHRRRTRTGTRTGTRKGTRKGTRRSSDTVKPSRWTKSAAGWYRADRGPHPPPLPDPLVAALALRSVWRVGSRAQQRERPESDGNILVVMPNGTPPEELDPIA
jgi:hypothetical protein